ncbi:MAG: ATPase, T2SS/T4P/T4SS family [Gammaproteobacteria bacterium]
MLDASFDAPVVKFIADILETAIHKGASDVHFEPYEKYYRVRLRIDGILHEIAKADLALTDQYSARLKVMARLDVAEKRLPQDGRFTLRLSKEQNSDCRISTCPTLFGEKVVVRILPSSSVALDLVSLGLNSEEQEIFLRAIKKPEGMILVTGPTGSGKTVSLYAALNILNAETRNIISIEDPIEIQLPGINQVEVHPKIGLTFAKALRSFLRQDPDVIMLGEIRDLDTAEIAVRAAQTGHLVLATLHTNSALEAVTRLLNLGVPVFNLAGSLQLVIAQRLVRRLCPHCKKEIHFSKEKWQASALSVLPYSKDQNICQAVGCSNCNKGYAGRIGIFEFLPFTNQMGEVLLRGNDLNALAILAEQNGLQKLRMSAARKILEGVTSLEEVERIIM